ATLLAANAVCIGRKVIAGDMTGDLRKELGQRGYEVALPRIGAFARSGGSAYCLTLRLDRTSARDAAKARPATLAHSWRAGRTPALRGLGEVLVDEIPVDEVLDHRGHEVGTPVAVIDVVGMLPHVDGEKRSLAFGQGIFGVRGIHNRELAAVQHQPGPAAAELP